MFGPAPVLDFDGTIAVLDVDWASLRRNLDVKSIDDLWSRPDATWDSVTSAEVEAAARAEPVEVTIRALEAVRAFAVLTSNSEIAVQEFFRRFNGLAGRLGLVIGRESLGGPKWDPARFRAGFERCVAATTASRTGGEIVYVGDAEYELRLAAQLGARVLDARSFHDHKGT